MNVEEDPFEQVAKDTKEQIERLAHYLNGKTNEDNEEVQDIIQDVEETIEDLEKSISVMQKNGQNTIERESQVQNLKETLQKLKLQRKTPSATAVNLNLEHDHDDEQENTNHQFENPFQEQMLREQDTHLDSIHHTMTNLHLQAQTMGEELEDQGEMLNDMDTNIDTLANKLSRGRRQLEWIYEKNKERYNDCCIGLLIAVLLILLVLAFIA